MKITCHCRNIEIEVTTPVQVTSCNCSICSRYNALWGYYKPEQVTISVGTAGQESYIWGDRELEFVRCSKCGCVTHYRTAPGQPDPRIAVNFRMAQEGEVENVAVRFFDGKNFL